MECAGDVCTVKGQTQEPNDQESVECSGGVCKVVHTTNTETPQQTKDTFDPVVDLVGEEIEDVSGNVHKTRDIVKGKIIGLYFSAIWCPPCRAFSPVLAKFCQSNCDEFVVIYVSSDRSESDMRQNLQGKPFFALPYRSGFKSKLSSMFRVSMIPTLVILTPDGEYITDWGRSAITKNADHCIQEWKEKKHGVSWMQLLKFF
eukprot:Phypoly_transcript_20890.p1 GENE.Phypoly_transcript_20890~~Phypoly_transcript_20890.p1  ORF type:complete len:213 (+),score=19.57 Phypoly_transcript_20890:34-639(+)